MIYSQYCKKPNENYVCALNRFKREILCVFALTNNYIDSNLCSLLSQIIIVYCGDLQAVNEIKHRACTLRV